MKELYDLYLDMPCLYFHFIWFDRDESKDLHCRKGAFKLDLTQNTYFDKWTFKIDSNTESGSYGVMVSMLTSNVLDRGLELRSDQIKDCIVGICCFSDKNSVYKETR